MPHPRWRERIRLITDRLLDIAGLSDPDQDQRPYQVGNDLGRTLSHLVAQDGEVSRLVRLDDNGRLEIKNFGNKDLPLYQDSSGRPLVSLDRCNNYPIPTVPNGVMSIMPYIQTHLPTDAATLDLSVAQHIDMATKTDRICRITGRFAGTEPYCLVSDGSGAAAPVNKLGYVDTYAPLVVFSEEQFLLFGSATNDGTVTATWWEI